MNGEAYWRSIRREFRLSADLVHLSGFWLSSHPRRVRDRIEQHRRGLDENPYLYVTRNEEFFENEMYTELEQLLSAEPGEVAVTESTTTGLGYAFNGMSLEPNAEILTTLHEHYSSIASLELLARRTGAKLNAVQLYEDGVDTSTDEIVDRLVSALTPATRLVVLTLVHSCTGVVIPLTAITAAVRARLGNSVIVAVDATHAIGALPINVQMLGCDLLAGGCHKWLNGPRGTGVIWGKLKTLESIVETIPSFAVGSLGRFTGRAANVPVTTGQRLSPGGFHCFEHRWAIAEAVRFMTAIGIGNVYARIQDLAERLKERLSEIRNVRVITPMGRENSAGIVCFEVAGIEPEETMSQLLRNGVVASVSPYRRRYCRFTPFIFNLFEDIERAATTVAAIA
ncbi:MAG TPA: aminotransferase class V-fold PLP-dependent enzyme [Thermoanaerobaculia bacterium]|jgi:isopenicillin-N epimerase|nr:aminotransferase class V-fold PLP-dependent enzyme [Thermoanaerobaculia bacterium]